MFIGMLFYYIIPFRERLLVLETQTRQQEEKNEQLEKYGLQDQRSEKLVLQEKDRLLQQKLPSGPEVGSFLLEVEQAAKESGVSIVQIRPRELHQEASWRQIPVELAARGSFQNMQLFLTFLGNLNRLAVLQSMVLQEQQEDVQAKFTITIYCEKEN
nr:type 4a pilus biogenesis protein PilO [uncultured Anaeromusa sp.]